jgi:hypothetical protein
MTAGEAVVPPGWSEFYESTGIPAAVRVGNLGETLAAGDASWEDVVELTSITSAFGNKRRRS